MVSALSKYKRVHEAIDACCLVARVHLVVAGGDPELAMLEARAAKLIPDRFTIVRVPHEQMPALFRSSDVIVHLALDEAFGNVYLEAMASGFPVVAHDSNRTRRIVGDQEFLVDTSQLGRIAVGIKRATQKVRLITRTGFAVPLNSTGTKSQVNTRAAS